MRPLLVLLVLLSAFHTAVTQTTEADLRTRLLKQPLYLRGQWSDDKLRFDAAGQLMGKANTASFTVAGLDIHSLELKPDHLVLHGDRMGIQFSSDQPKRVRLSSVRIEMAAPPNGDYTKALDLILTPDLASLVPAMPSYWLPFARKHLLPTSSPAASLPGPIKIEKLPGATNPRLLTSIEPVYPKEAKDLRYSGVTRIVFNVNTQGVPEEVTIAHPTGIGLDEAAVAAVLQYRFTPAMSDGHPVPATLIVDVRLQTF